MSNYSEKTVDELIKQLIKEEDRASFMLVKQLAGRGEQAASPLREILQDEYYWYEGRGGEHWIVVHAIVALSAMRDEKTIPILIEMAPHAYFSDHDGAIGVLQAALANFGEPAIDHYMKFVQGHRGAFRFNPDYSYCRYNFVAALVRIALENEHSRDRITEFICNLFTDPEEDDKTLLSLSADYPVLLAGERGSLALIMARRRGILEDLEEEDIEYMLDDVLGNDLSKYSEFSEDIFDFYNSRAVKARELKRKEEENRTLYWGEAFESQSDSAAKVGRNDPCPCGSGKKYKKCCGG